MNHYFIIHLIVHLLDSCTKLLLLKSSRLAFFTVLVTTYIKHHLAHLAFCNNSYHYISCVTYVTVYQHEDCVTHPAII